MGDKIIRRYACWIISAVILGSLGTGLAAPPTTVVRASVDDTGAVRIPIEAEDMHGVQWGPQGFTPKWTAGLWGRDLHQNMIFGSAWASRMAAAVTDESDAPATVAQDFEVPRTARYKVWARYECPPFFNYPFTIRIEKLGSDARPSGPVFEKLYGLRGAAKHFSFSEKLRTGDLYWGWGIDHDAAEGYETVLAAGRYRLTLAKAPLPAGYRGPVDAGGLPALERVGARSVDAILITSLLSENSGPVYAPPANGGYVATHDWPIYRSELNNFPVLPELQRANHLYVRFQNTGTQPILISYDHWNHRGAHVVYNMSSWSMRLVRFYDAAGKPITDDQGAPLWAANGQWAKPIGPGESSPWIDIGPTMNPESSCPFTATATPAPGGSPATAAPPLFAMDLALAPAEKGIVKSFTRTAAEPYLAVLIQPDLHRRSGQDATLKVTDVFCQMTSELEAYPRVGPVPKQLRLYGALGWVFGVYTLKPDRLDFSLGLDYALSLGLNTLPLEHWQNTPLVDRIQEYYAAHGATLVEPSGRFLHTTNPDDVKGRFTKPDPANPKAGPVVDAAARARLYVTSFGDEIVLPVPDTQNESMRAEFQAFLQARGVPPADLGAKAYDECRILPAYTAAAAVKAGLLPQPGTNAPPTLPPGEAGQHLKRVWWWSRQFAIDRGIRDFAEKTRQMTALVGPHFKTTANLGSMAPFFWMEQATFIESFRGGAMTLGWSEDYDYCQPEATRLVVDFEAAYLRAGAKYHDTPVMFYCMPHYPGNTGQHLIQNAVTFWGQGVKDLDFFYVSPDAFAAENYISFRGGIAETGRGIRQISGMAGNIEEQLLPARTRPARVALLLSEASDLWELDGQTSQWVVEPGSKATNVSQEERKNLWYCLRLHGYLVDLLTENDVAEGRLKDYQVLYVCGRNLDRRAVAPITQWVRAGGSLFLTAGAARQDQYDEPLADLDALVGRGPVEQATLYRGPLRAKLELLQLSALDSLVLAADAGKIDVLASQELFTPAANAQVLDQFGKTARPALVTVATGKGRGYYVGALPGQAYVRAALLPVRPMGKGGPEWNYSQWEPVAYDAHAAAVILTPVRNRHLAPEATVNHRGVVANILHNPQTTLVTLVNLAKTVDGPARDLEITIPGLRPVKSVATALKARAAFENHPESVTIKLAELDDADVIVLHH